MDNSLDIACETDVEPMSVISDVVFVQPEDIKLPDECSRPDVSMPVENIQSVNLSVESDVPVQNSCLDVDNQEINEIPYIDAPSAELIEPEEILVSHEVAVSEKNGLIVSNECVNDDETDIHVENLSLDSCNLNQDDNSLGEALMQHDGNESDNLVPSADLSVSSDIDKSDSGSSVQESQRANDDTSVRRSSRIRSIAEKKKQKCVAPVKTDKGVTSEVQCQDSKNEAVINSEAAVFSDTVTNGKQSLVNSESAKKNLSKKERLSSSKSRGRPKGKKSENPRLKKKPDVAMEVDLPVQISSPGISSCKTETGITKNGTTSKREDNDSDNPSPPHQCRDDDDCPSEGKLGVASMSAVVDNKTNGSGISIATELSTELYSASVDTVLDSKGVLPGEKTQGDEHSTLKPEKVKSRWRRSCELEHGELLSGNVKSALDAKTQGCNGIKESLTPILEESSVTKSVSAQSQEVVPLAEAKAKLPQFELIDENIYRFERKRCKTKKEVRRMLCDCTLTKEEVDRGAVGCEDDCLNRLLMIECGSRCAIGEFCSNKRFQKKRYVKTEPFMTEKKGWGLRVLEDVDAGSFIMEYVGEVLSRHEFKQRVKQYAREKCNHYYFMALKSDEIIDATNKGNVSRFINHSCNPNCETQKWTVNGELRIGFFTKQALKAGEELTFDYKFQRYGREAQKCHCESENCTGYIGEAKPLSLEGGSSNKVSVKRKKSVEEKKRAVFEDLIFDEELEKLCSNGGLRNRAETLILARLMVRAEDVISRLCLLDVILKTTDVPCLRLFVDYHGLSLLWSWMADVNELDSFKLKSRILQVLSILPIPNKTVLLDSKVLNLVHKWCVEQPENKGQDSQKLDKVNENKQPEKPAAPDAGLSDEPLSKRNKLSDSLDICSDTTKDGMERKTPVSNISDGKVLEDFKFGNTNSPQSVATKDAPSLSLKPAGGNGMSKSDEDSVDTVEEDDERKADVASMATKLLQSWASLSEEFRIPRVEKQKRRADELEADRRAQKNKHAQVRESSSESTESIPQAKSNSESKENGASEKLVTENLNDRKYMKKIQVCVTEDCSRPRKTSISTPRMTKHERRQLFALEVQNRDRDKEVLRKHDEKPAVVASTNSYEYPSHSQSYDNTYYYDESGPYAGSCETNTAYPKSSSALNFPSDGGSVVHQPPRTSFPPAPSFPENVTFNVPPPQYPDVAPRVPYPPPGMMFNTPPPQLPFLGAPPPSLSQPPPSLLPPPTNLPGASNVPVITNMPAVSPIQPSPTAGLAPVALPPQNIPVSVASSSCMPRAPLLPTQTAPPITSIPPPIIFPGQSTVPPANVPPFVGTQNQPVYYPYTQSTPSTSTSSEQFTTDHYSSPSTSKVVPNKPVKLPPNWKTATDPEGTIYYYHAITRQTQWDPPECDESDDDDDDEDDDDDSDTPVYDEPKSKRRSTTTAAADTSFAIEVAKKIKELFRTKMSSFVVQCLNAYRKPECTVGRIQSTEDFKYLARKLTHFVMAKELKHCKNVEELECNENVKHKAKDYIMKYMSKFGPHYRKEKTPSDRDRV